MNLFFDEVVAFVHKNPSLTELRALKEGQVQKFEVSNLAAILPPQYTASEFPSLAPPYPNLWFEWVTEPEPRLKFGVFLVSEKTEDGWDCTCFFFNSLPNSRSLLSFCTIVTSFTLPNNGRFSEEALVKYFQLPRVGKMLVAITDFEVQFLAKNFLTRVFFALGLLHCKNIVAEARGGLNPQIHSRRHRAKGTRHHILQILPGRESKRRLSEQAGQGLPRSLHFRRGHFKEYTAENPLFGKYTGVFWWEAHVAGQAAIGTVTKDYQLLPPKNGLGAPVR